MDSLYPYKSVSLVWQLDCSNYKRFVWRPHRRRLNASAEVRAASIEDAAARRAQRFLRGSISEASDWPLVLWAIFRGGGWLIGFNGWAFQGASASSPASRPIA